MANLAAKPTDFGVYVDDGSGSLGDLCPASPRVVGVTQNMRVTRGQALYVLSAPGGYYKVGIAKNPLERMRNLQCGNPLTISLEAWTSLDRDGVDAAQMEQLVHEALSMYRANGEWFKADPAIIGRAVKEAWCKLRCPSLYSRWNRFRLHMAVSRKRRANEKANG